MYRKSQLAIEHAYRVGEEYPPVWVFWVYGGSDARFEQGYRTIADRVKIPSWDEAEANVVDLVNAWLSNEVNGRWLMVLDNVDHLRRPTTEVGDSTLEAGPMSSIPQTRNGSVLITSRNKDAAFRLVGRHCDIINVEPMDESHALQLLRKKIVGDKDQGNAMQLVQALDYMPLAINQAGAFISRCAPRMTILKYLDIFQKSDGHQADLLNRDMGDMRRDHSQKNAIFTTWKISFEHIREQRASAARLLSLMCLFDRQGIPETLLRHRYPENLCEVGSPVNVDTDLPANGDLGFEEDISTLTDYSLIRMANEEGTSFEMHRLVQSSTRWWLRSSEHLKGWQKKYIRIMAEVFPNGGYYGTWATCRALFPHAKVVLEYQPADSEHLIPWADLLTRAGDYALQMSYYSTAEEMSRRALEVREKVLGEKHPHTLSSVYLLAGALFHQSRLQDAEEVGRRALEGRRKALGEKHEATLESVNGLAMILHEQRKFEVAEMMHRRVLEEREKTLGKEHLNTLSSANNLALVLRDQGKLEAAEEMLQRVLKGKEKALGEEHPTTLTTVHDLAIQYYFQDRYQDAEPLFQRAIRGYENALGKEHHHTRAAVDILAVLYSNQERYQDAELLFQRLIRGCENALGKEHQHTLGAVGNLGVVYRNQERYQDAELLFQRVIRGRENTLGKEHPDTLEAVGSLGVVYRDQERYQDAELLFQRAIRGGENALGKEHLHTLEAIYALASTYYNQERYQDAEPLFQRVYTGFQLTLGPDHRWTIECREKVSSLLEKSKASSSRTVLRSNEEPRSDEGRNTGSTVAPHPSQSSESLATSSRQRAPPAIHGGRKPETGFRTPQPHHSSRNVLQHFSRFFKAE
ncbi:MAG: hypothetical protein Q9193_004798 [Seirophora villosa]